MANLCSNRLIVLGTSADEVEVFDRAFSTDTVINWEHQKRKKINKMRYSFDSLVPVPESILKIGYNGAAYPKSISKLPIEDKIQRLDEAVSGYKWSINNWGTKWDLMELVKSHRKGNSIEYCFETAWSPPIKWVQKVSALFPNLVFSIEYNEPGFLLAGVKIFVEGCFVELVT